MKWNSERRSLTHCWSLGSCRRYHEQYSKCVPKACWLIRWLVVHPENSMFSGYAPSNPHTIQTLKTWTETSSHYYYFPFRLSEMGCLLHYFMLSLSASLSTHGNWGWLKASKSPEWGGGVERRKKDRNRGDRETCWKGQAFIQQRNMCTSPEIQFV